MRSTLLIVLIQVFAFSCSGQGDYERVRIMKIDSSDNYFFIHGKYKKSGERILIVSKKSMTNQNCNEVELKETYSLELVQFLDSETLEDLPAKPPGTLKLREDGYIIWDGESSLPLRAKNIQGLCFLE
ncbi:MAG: hypothetical protein GY816_12970 [Cytophagales bacterium]|nr:hypothetical protein [Cytophagales bacterium]